MRRPIVVPVRGVFDIVTAGHDEDPLEFLQDVVQIGFADFLLKYAIVLAAAGALAMAFVELAKKLFDWRTSVTLV